MHGREHDLIDRHAVLALLDQGDIVIGIWVALLPIWVMTPLQALAAFAVVTAAHLVTNVAGYAIGARRVARPLVEAVAT